MAIRPDPIRNARTSLALTLAALLASGCALAHPELARLPTSPASPEMARREAVEVLASARTARAAASGDTAAAQALSARVADAEAVCALRDCGSLTPEEKRDGPRYSLRLVETVAEARRLAEDYSVRQRKAAKALTILQLPVLGAAAFAASTVLNGVGRVGEATAAAPDGRLRRLGEIGIGVGVFTAARDRLLPASLPGVYIGGYRAMACIIAEAPYFLSKDNLDAHDRFATATGHTTQSLITLRQLIDGLPVKQRNELATEIALAEATIQLAAPTINAALIQLREYRARESTFETAVADTSISVAKGALVTEPFDFRKLQDKLFTAPTPTPPAKADPKAAEKAISTAGRPTAPTPGELLMQRQAQLEANRRALEAATPDYAAPLARVRACPAKVTS